MPFANSDVMRITPIIFQASAGDSGLYFRLRYIASAVNKINAAASNEENFTVKTTVVAALKIKKIKMAEPAIKKYFPLNANGQRLVNHHIKTIIVIYKIGKVGLVQ